ncbi:hypothetical protein EPUS_08611 [Endocarpon pusillum Z07020]|uniref:GDP/GTP exchange factor Sec2 N-terminal domain-containing protein n=1 Tax=Endocarpon pusillum (strain Z07020 / HMAS-L-300199) TaxID=1263415 RepID=U1G6N6_ENDPU|nr:uncharacterized protein EPUS_08611 [Endocarpon pusillum Z07020]ERF73047.1 hypothetical protein EPUS_08611 [Endocarpon pusillum Z07020]
MSLVQSLPSQNLPHTVCAQCGSGISHIGSAEEAQRRILELEAQIRSLNTKAAAAGKSIPPHPLFPGLCLLTLPKPTSWPITKTSSISCARMLKINDRAQVPHLASFLHPSKTAIASLLKPNPPHRRKDPRVCPPCPRSSPAAAPPVQSHLAPTITNNTSTHSLPTVLPNNTTQPPGSPDPASETLTTMLQAEKKARLAAESSLSQAHNELEELTAQLFSQANEMVATERKARAKLEERIELLEKRDGDKRVRLDRLEKAMGRIERVRGLVT